MNDLQLSFVIAGLVPVSSNPPSQQFGLTKKKKKKKKKKKMNKRPMNINLVLEKNRCEQKVVCHCEWKQVWEQDVARRRVSSMAPSATIIKSSMLTKLNNLTSHNWHTTAKA